MRRSIVPRSTLPASNPTRRHSSMTCSDTSKVPGWWESTASSSPTPVDLSATLLNWDCGLHPKPATATCYPKENRQCMRAHSLLSLPRYEGYCYEVLAPPVHWSDHAHMGDFNAQEWPLCGHDTHAQFAGLQ